MLFVVGWSASGQYYYDFNENCRNAYSSINSLKFEEGKSLIEKEKSLHPDNNIPYLLQNYIYFLTVFIGEEEADFDLYDDLKDDLIDRLKDGDENSPYYRYCLAQVYLQWAVARTKFKEYVTATFEINKAYRMLEDNQEDYPDFLPTFINLGLLHTMIGTIPDNYNWVKRMVGIEGTIDQGVEEILAVLNKSMTDPQYSHYRAECLFYLSFIQMNLMTNKNKTIEYLEVIEKDQSNLENPLAIYALARIYMSNEKNDRAIEILLNRPTSKEYYPFYYLDYLTGMAKLHRLDEDANKYFFRYVINFKGINYIKDAYQKIAWNYYVQSNSEKYKEYMSKVLKYGNTVVDADKQAEREAEEGLMPNYHLLRARVLFDGGYYEKAMQELTQDTHSEFLTTERDSLECSYRLGRIYHEWGKVDESIQYYTKTIKIGSESSYYYAANSALKLGNIYEDLKDYKKAEYYYEAAQSMENKEYRNSINSKAKAGLNRIEDKL
ncbi:MAG: tetratricopeptide repeat protein [Ignavibacteriales bacterium]|nr:tetratricopeptide repeat protein [Ignavibacteriales bacterium]